MKIYIAGKITGDPEYKQKFDTVRDNLQADDVVILSPADLPAGMSNEDYMLICLSMIFSADAVMFLPDWQISLGAQIEHAICEYVKKNILYYKAAVKA
jgi:hypothetical protein